MMMTTSVIAAIRIATTAAMRKLMHSLSSDKGQMTAELVIVIPAILLALVVIVNLGMFSAETARFDRIVGEVSRSLVTSPEDPAVAASYVLQEAMGYSGGRKGPFTVKVNVEKDSDFLLKKRTLNFSLEYELFATGILANTKAVNLRSLSRNKTFVIYWNTGL